MSLYELAYIVSGDVLEEQLKETQKEVIKVIAKNQGKVIKEDFWGKKELAYPIKKQRFGFYNILVVDLPPENIASLDHELKLINSIIRYLIVKQEIVKKEKVKPSKRIKKAVKPKIEEKIKKEKKEIKEEKEKKIAEKEREAVLDKKLEEILKEE